MPTSGTQNDTANDSFYNLLKNYGLTTSVTGSVGTENYNIATTPLYFVRSGYVEMNSGRLWHASASGNYWSAVAMSKRPDGVAVISAYNFNFSAEVTNPSGGPGYRRWFGFPLRCLAKGRPNGE